MEEKYIRVKYNGNLKGKVHILEGEDTKCKLFQNYRTTSQQKGLREVLVTTNILHLMRSKGLSYHEVEKPEQSKPNHCCGACFNIKKKKKKKKKLGKLPKVIPTKTGTPRNHKNKYRWYE